MDNEKKEAILKAAQANKAVGKEYENNIGIRGILIASLSSCIVCIVIVIVEYMKKSSINLGLVGVGFTACGVSLFYEGLRLKTIWKIIIGLLILLFALACVIAYLRQVIA